MTSIPAGIKAPVAGGRATATTPGYGHSRIPPIPAGIAAIRPSPSSFPPCNNPADELPEPLSHHPPSCDPAKGGGSLLSHPLFKGWVGRPQPTGTVPGSRQAPRADETEVGGTLDLEES